MAPAGSGVLSDSVGAAHQEFCEVFLHSLGFHSTLRGWSGAGWEAQQVCDSCPRKTNRGCWMPREKEPGQEGVSSMGVTPGCRSCSSLRLNVTPNPGRSFCVTPNPAKILNVTPNPAGSLRVTPNPERSLCVTPNPAKTVTVTPNPAEILSVTPNPERSLNVASSSSPSSFSSLSSSSSSSSPFPYSY